MIKRYAFKDNSGKLHYRSRHSLEKMQQTPGFSYQLLHWWNWNYWRIRTLHWKISKQRIPALIDTQKKKKPSKRFLAKKVAFRDNTGKLQYRSNYTLQLMQQTPGFTFVKVGRLSPDYWKARKENKMAIKANAAMGKKPVDKLWAKRVAFIDKRGHIVYTTQVKFDKLRENPDFSCEILPVWRFDFWKAYFSYWTSRIGKWRWTKMVAVLAVIALGIYITLAVLYKMSWSGPNAKKQGAQDNRYSKYRTMNGKKK